MHKGLEKKIIIAIIVLLIITINSASTKSQVKFSGRIINSENNEPLNGAHILLNKTMGAYCDSTGYFYIQNIPTGKYKIKISCIGFETTESKIEFNTNQEYNQIFYLKQIDIQTDDVIITATKTENNIGNIPGRINIISSKTLQNTPIQCIDNALQYTSGVRINRSFGICSTKSTVSMRGLNGNEQARVLVLLDGVPINKSDGGTVDWNMINPDFVHKIEVTKGAASSLYGGNAMGGVVNIITSKPKGKLNISGNLEYGTYNTLAARYSFSGKTNPSQNNKGFYWIYSGLYRKSDGYITQSEQDQMLNPYITKSNVKEFANNLKLGYEFDKNQSVDLTINYYDDMRGTGEVIHQNNGNITEHDSYGGILKYKNNLDKLSINIHTYFLQENYKKVNEYIKDDYTWYEVLSQRSDYGISTFITLNSIKHNIFTYGIDFRNGAVDAKDVYLTSTDIVYNKGKMAFYALFIQDEINLINNKLRIIGGIRFDYAKYYDGSFYISSPTSETFFLEDLQQNEMPSKNWNAISPKITAQYRLNDFIRFYAGFAKGFRASVLDDLCRTGRIKGGLKIANPDLKPEYLNNYEAGFDLDIAKYHKLSFSGYYSRGKDFMYYVSTGKTIDMGFGDRPILTRDNISQISILGFETELKSKINQDLDVFVNYTFNHSIITNYKRITTSDTLNLDGKYLTDIPKHNFSGGIIWINKIVNTTLFCNYTGSMWINDANIYDEIVLSDQYPSYFTLDAKISKTIFKHITLSISVQNIFDNKFYDSKGAVCPGRFVTGAINLKL